MIECKKIVSINHPDSFSTDTHTHSLHEMVYCLDGSAWVCIEGKKYEFSAGDYYIVHRGTPHSEKAERDTRIIYFSFNAPDTYTPWGVYTDHDGSVITLVKKLQIEMKLFDSYAKDMAQCFVKAILTQARRTAEGIRINDGMVSVLQYIDENIEQDIDFKLLAQKQHYSFDHFRHVFKEYTGMSPHRYLVKGRLEKACFLLKMNPKISLSELSYNCGFASSSHFTKAFRANMGMSPSQYAMKYVKYKT